MEGTRRIQKYVLRIRFPQGEKVIVSDVPPPRIAVGESVLWDYETTRQSLDVSSVFHRFHDDGAIYELDVWLEGSHAI